MKCFEDPNEKIFFFKKTQDVLKPLSGIQIDTKESKNEQKSSKIKTFH